MISTLSSSTRWRIARWSLAGALLLLPLVAMQFTHEVNWTGSDFLLFGMMLVVAGLAYEVVAHAAGSLPYRLGAFAAVGTGFLLVWVNLAVGILGDGDNPANLVFVAVLIVAVLGAVLARRKPAGMATAMAATAGAQVLAGALAMAGGWGTTYEIALGTVLFATLWLVSAGLFAKAASAPIAKQGVASSARPPADR